MKPKTQIAIGKWTAFIMVVFITLGICYFFGINLCGNAELTDSEWGYPIRHPVGYLVLFLNWAFCFGILGAYVASLNRRQFKRSVLLWSAWLLYNLVCIFYCAFYQKNPISLFDSTVVAQLVILFLMYQGIWGMHRERRQSLIVEHETKDNNEQKD